MMSLAARLRHTAGDVYVSTVALVTGRKIDRRGSFGSVTTSNQGPSSSNGDTTLEGSVGSKHLTGKPLVEVSV
jgi:hypothetical protein